MKTATNLKTNKNDKLRDQKPKKNNNSQTNNLKLLRPKGFFASKGGVEMIVPPVIL